MNLVEETLSAPHPANGYRIQRVLYHLRHYYTRPIYRDRCDYSAASRPYRRCRPARQGNRRRSGRASKIAHPSFQLPRHCRPCRHDEPFQHARCRGIEPSALSAVRMFSHPIWNLFKFYVLRGGFFDGGSGLYAAMTAAFYVFLKYSESLRAPSRSAPRGKTAPLLWFATTRLGCRKPPMRRSPLFGIAKIVGRIEPINLFAIPKWRDKRTDQFRRFNSPNGPVGTAVIGIATSWSYHYAGEPDHRGCTERSGWSEAVEPHPFVESMS